MAEEKKLVRWSKTAVTDIGTRLLADYAAGRLLDITSAFGSIGTPGDNLFELEELADGRTHPLTIESVTKTENSVTVCVQVTSLGNNEPYKLDRVGVYAVSRDPGEPKPPAGAIGRDDKLLMVVEDAEDENGSKGVTIPAETDQLYTFKLYVVLTITNKDRLEVSISAAGIATIGAIHEAIKEHDKDPEAHQEAFAAHNADLAAHPGIMARVRATEIALNGKETIIVPEGDPTPETVGAKGQHYINFATGAEFVCNDIKDGKYIWGPVDNSKSMRDLLAQAADTAAQAKEIADGAAQAIAAVQNTISVIPSQSGSLTYNGSTQKPSWNNYATEMMEVTYGSADDPEERIAEEDFNGETAAGTYMAYFTPKEGYTWGDKSDDEKMVPWIIQRATITSTPSVSGPLSYTGEPQLPIWQNFNPEQLTKTETAQAGAGDYTTLFTPTKNYQWSDGRTGAKPAAWSIGKAAGSLTLDKTTMTLNSAAAFGTITATRAGDGAISAQSSEPSVATVSVSENTVLVSAVGDGTAIVTVEVAEGSNHTAPESKSCTAKVDIPSIYGVQWDGTSTTKWTRTDEAAGFTDPVPYVAGAGSYGSPFDNLQPWAGMVKSNRTGGVMVAIPKFWYKLTKNGNGLKAQIATKATAGFSVSPAHMNRGDGKGERDVVYIGRYHCGTDFKSNSGQVPKVSTTRANFRTSIHNLGPNIWQGDFALRFTLWLLYLVEFADWNTQKTIGKGCGNNSAAQNMGYTDSMPYHTGTTQSSRDTYGLGTQYRNIEGLWDNCYDFADGCYNNSNGLNIILNPNDFSDSGGGTSIGIPAKGWPSAFDVNSKAGFPVIVPTATAGSETTYTCDDWDFDAGHPVVYVGSYYNQNSSRGLFCVHCTDATSVTVGLGSRPQELP